MAERSKSARNEQKKLLGTFFNNISVALFLAAGLQPVMAIAQGQRSVEVAELLLSAILIAVGALLLVVAQVMVSWIED